MNYLMLFLMLPLVILLYLIFSLKDADDENKEPYPSEEE